MPKYRKYIFAVIFLKGAKYEFLILHRKKNWKGWELLKGGLLEDEDETGALKREMREETGSRKFKIVARTRHMIKYKWTKGYRKDHHIFHGARGRLFLVQTFDRNVKIDRSEHDGFKWADPNQTLKYLAYTNLKHAFKYVLRNYKL